MTLATVTSILDPRAIAIVGASDDVAKWGGSLLALLGKFGFPGAIYPVNPRLRTVQGLPAYPSVEAIGRPVDVAVLAVPHDNALAAVEDCAKAGVKSILMVTSQFAEAGDEGLALQNVLVATARTAGMRIVGPNCMGYFNSHADLCLLNAQALRHVTRLPRGKLALISQSGALAGAMLARAIDLGVGFSFTVSLGNQADLEVSDFLEYAVQDAATEVIALYVEGLKDPARFVRLLHAARSAGKPVLLLKAGRTAAGAQAVQSHTASLAGGYAGFAAAVRHAGALLVDDFLELVEQAAAWCSLPPPHAGNLAVFSGSGGGGAVASDLATEAGLTVAKLNPVTTEMLTNLVPARSAHLPFDLGAVLANYLSGPPQWLGDVLTVMMHDRSVGAGLFVMTTQPDMPGTARAVVAANKASGKPLLFVNAASSCGDEAVEALREAGLANFQSVKGALSHLVNVQQYLRQRDDVRAVPVALPDAVTEIVAQFTPGLVPAQDAQALLGAAGLPVAPSTLATSADEAVAQAQAIGFPVVLKLVSAQISHKSDVGGVVLNVADEAAVRTHFAALQAATARVPGAHFDGCLVQPQVAGDTELIVGTHWDTQFGAMLLVGFGGTLVELHRDTALLPADASRAAIAEALAGLRGYPQLTGYRGRPAANLEAVIDLVQALGNLALQLGPQLAECEANPVRIDGATLTVADARAVWHPANPV